MTIKTITVNENEVPVFCTVEEATQYFAERFNGEKWEDLSEDEKKRAMITASRKINGLRFKGFKADIKQPLEFPRFFKPVYLSKRSYSSMLNAKRINGKDYIYIELPEEMIAACCEEALSLVQRTEDSIHIKNQRLGIASTSIMGDSVTYTGNGAATSDGVCDEALQYLDKYLMKVARVV